MKKHVLVIGGTKGIGLTLVQTLAKEGYVVSVIARKPFSKTGLEIPGAHFWAVDATKQEDLANAFERILQKNNKLNYLIFFQQYRGKGDDWEGQIETSLTATKNIIELLVDKFDEANENSITVINSIASYFVAEEQPLSYHVAKAGLVQMVRYYAVVLGPRGIRVNCVSPSSTLKEESKDFYLKNEELYNINQKVSPLGRMVTSQDVANVVQFLCSSKSSAITGQNIFVDCGISLQGQECLARKLKSLKHLSITRRNES